MEIVWAEYELRRRVQFALELLLEAFTETLMGLVEGTVGRIIETNHRRVEDRVLSTTPSVQGSGFSFSSIRCADKKNGGACPG